MRFDYKVVELRGEKGVPAGCSGRVFRQDVPAGCSGRMFQQGVPAGCFSFCFFSVNQCSYSERAHSPGGLSELL